MKTKMKLVLWARKKADGRFPVYLRVTKDRASGYIPTQIDIYKTDWLKAGERVKDGHPQHEGINAILNTEKNRVMSEVAGLELKKPEINIQELLQILTRKGEKEAVRNSSFFPFAEIMRDRCLAENRINTFRRYDAEVRRLKKFAGNAEIEFKEIDYTFLKKYESHLIRRDVNQMSIYTYMKTIRAIFNEAIKEGLIDYSIYPFRKFKLAKSSSGKKVFLFQQELSAIMNLDLTPFSPAWNARNYFMFSFATAGMRFSDLSRLKWEQITTNKVGAWNLDYQMEKTGRFKGMTINPIGRKILELYTLPDSLRKGYVFPILRSKEELLKTERDIVRRISSQNTRCNALIKDVCQKAGIPENKATQIGMHSSRHGFANFGLKSGWSPYELKAHLGHSSVKITEIYLAEIGRDDLNNQLQTMSL